MYPYIHIIGGEVISSYNLMAGLGLIAAILTFGRIAKKQNIHARVVDDMSVLFTLIIISAAVSSVLLNNFEHNSWNFSSPEAFVSGFTFYGGLLGGGLTAVVGSVVICKKEISLFYMLDILSVCLMVGHSIGRIGCFLGGCCYGKAANSIFAIPYPINGTWIRVYPVQLIESLFLFLLFLYSYKHLANSFGRYLISYGIFRFFIEFLRGDDRGITLYFSASQWISIMLATTGIFVLRTEIAKKRQLMRSLLPYRHKYKKLGGQSNEKI